MKVLLTKDDRQNDIWRIKLNFFLFFFIPSLRKSWLFIVGSFNETRGCIKYIKNCLKPSLKSIRVVVIEILSFRKKKTYYFISLDNW